MTEPLCNGDSNGEMALTITGGTAPYSVVWESDAAVAVALDGGVFTKAGLAAGTYNATVTDANSCVFTQTYTVTEPALISVSENITQPLCNANSNGGIELTITGGTAPYSVVWESDAAVAVALEGGVFTKTGLAVGTYDVQITDAHNCVETLTYTITQPELISISETMTEPLCNGDSNGEMTLTLSGGTAPYAVVWESDPISVLTGDIFTKTNLAAGTYNVTVSDINSCVTLQSFIVTEPASIAVVETMTEPLCNGDSNGEMALTITGGTAPYSVVWESDAAVAVALEGEVFTKVGLAAGTYNATITDANSCVFTQTYIVTEPASIAVVETMTEPLCNGDSNGEMALTITGGTAPYSVVWESDAAVAVALEGEVFTKVGLAAGTYNATITDANSCVFTQTYTVTEPSSIAVAETMTEPLCNGDSNGEMALTITGGTAPYSVVWESDAAVAVALDGDVFIKASLAAGTYNATITDANSCVFTQTYIVTEPASIAVVETMTEPLCNGDSNGEMALTITGGTAPYSVVWESDAAVAIALDGDVFTKTGLAAGTYNATVTDANSCVFTQSFTVTQPEILEVAQQIALPLCNGDSNGEVLLTISGGVAPYSIVWETELSAVLPGNTYTKAGLAAGTYTAIITDANGCINTQTVTVGQPDQMNVTLVDIVNVECFGDLTGSIEINLTGGTGDYTVAWGTGAGQSDSDVTLAEMTGYQITGLAVDTYDVTITDANACSTSLVGVQIQGPSSQFVVVSSSLEDVTCHGGNNGSINIAIEGGGVPYVYTWENQTDLTTGTNTIAFAPSMTPLQNLTAGNYSLSLTDGYGCLQITNFVIGQPDAIAVAETLIEPLCNGNSNGEVELQIAGGTAPYTLKWDTDPNVLLPGDTFIKDNLAAGSYGVTITDANNCLLIHTVVLGEPNVLTVTNTVTDVVCNAGITGAVNLTIVGGLPNYEIAWSPANVLGESAATSTVDGLFVVNDFVAGSYDFIITDANACQQVLTNIVISQPTVPFVAVVDNQIPATCYGGNDGGLEISLTGGGDAAYTFSWVNNTDGTLSGTINAGTNPNQINNLTAGDYTITALDALGCELIINTAVQQPDSITIAVDAIIEPLCNADTNGKINLNLSGGTGEYVVSWSPASADGTAQATTAGILEIDNLAVGTYSVTVTDEQNCQNISDITVDQPDVIVLTETVNIATCNGQADGSISLTINGGVAGYDITWSPANQAGLAAGTLATEGDIFEIQNLLAGTYSVTVVDVNGCISTKDIVVTQAETLVLTPNYIEPSCNGNSNGSIELTIDGGTPDYNISWSPSNTSGEVSGVLSTEGGTFVVDDLLAGPYNFIIVDANGCVEKQTYELDEPASIEIARDIIQPSCSGYADGKIALTVTGGTPVYNIDWSPANAYGMTSGSLALDGGVYQINDLAAGLYTITITDANACQEVMPITINQPNPLLLALENVVDTECFGEAIGRIEVTITGGTEDYSLAWGPNADQIATGISGINAIGYEITGLEAGNYSVDVTDANGCQYSLLGVQVEGPSAPFAVLAKDTVNVSCNGNMDGGITLALSGGGSPSSYSWINTTHGTAGNGIITQTPSITDLTGLDAGQYVLVIEDIFGCTKNIDFTIEEPDPIVVTIDEVVVPLCVGNANGEIELSVFGGFAPYQISWGPALDESQYNVSAMNALGFEINNLLGGTYDITVTDASGCAVITTQEIVEPGAITLSITQTEPVICVGESVTLTAEVVGGTAPFTYVWNNGLSNAVSHVVTPDVTTDYTVEVTDAYGCAVVSATAQVVINPLPEFMLTEASPISCNGESDAVIALTNVGGIAPYTVAWGAGANENEANISATDIENYSISNLGIGTYTITLTDGNTCVKENSITIVEPLALTLVLTSESASTFAENDGTATATPDLGVEPYSYSWANATAPTVEISTQQTATGLVTGDYVVTVTDANGCTVEGTVFVDEPEYQQPNIVILSEGLLDCFGDTDASLAIRANGGVQPFTYYWENVIGVNIDNDTLLTNLAAGNYYLTVTDLLMNQWDTVITIVAPELLEIDNIVVDNVNCFGETNGTALATVSGGTGLYTYSWRTNTGAVVGINSMNIDELPAGIYTLSVTDQNTCSTTEDFVISQPDELVTDLPAAITEPCNGGGQAGITIDVDGGSPAYNIVWYTENHVQVGIGETVTGLSTGDYYVSITDANSCEMTQIFEVTQPPALEVDMGVQDPLCYMQENGIVWVTASGGTPGYTYEWSMTGVQNNDTVYNVAQGTWYVTVTDANDCTVVGEIDVTHPDLLEISDVTTDIECNNTIMGTSTLLVQGGVGPYNYDWSTGNNAMYVDDLPGGIHGVTVTDANGCVKSHIVEVEMSGEFVVSISQTEYSLCYEDNISDFHAVSYGVAPFTYNWNIAGNTSQSGYTDMPVGTYLVTVTDIRGCKGMDSHIVSQNEELQVSFTYGDVLCKYGETGWIAAHATGGTGSYFYNWSHNGNTADSIYGLEKGIYMLDLFDSNGCIITDAVVISEPDSALSVETEAIDLTCFQSNDGQLLAAAAGGVAPYTYVWESEDNYYIEGDQTNPDLRAGFYRLTVTDVNFCKNVSNIIVEQPDPIQITIEDISATSCNGNNDGFIEIETIEGGTPPYAVSVTNGAVTYTQSDYFVEGLFAGTYFIGAVDSRNCTQRDIDIIKIQLEDGNADCVTTYNAFTPNGDGVNDRWRVENLHLFEGSLVQVYNRWGQLLYESTNPNESWDGTYKGKELPAGTYLYYIDTNDGSAPRSGTVTIVR